MQRFNSLMLHGGDPPVQSVKLQIQTAACSSGNTSVRGSGHREESCRRLSEAARQGELLSIKLLFYWLPNWPWNHCTEPGGFSS